MHDHAATEDMLRGSVIAWTALRNGFYAGSLPIMIGDAATTGVIAAPRDGKVAWTAHGDLAGAAAAVLRQERRFDGPSPPLTGSEALDLDDVAAILSDLRRSEIRRDVLDDDEQTARMSARGDSASVIEITLGLYRAARTGEFAALDPILAELVGHAPRTVHAVLAAGNDA